MRISYQVLKTNIIKSCVSNQKNKCRQSMFMINPDRLSHLVDDIGLTYIPTIFDSKDVNVSDIPIIAEYFKDRGLSWFNSFKDYIILTFIATESIDDDARELLALITDKTDRSIDKAEALAKIVDNYPCYFAMVISYKGNDLNNRLSYEVRCRANCAAIKQQNYEFNSKDM